jgi:hypothetical protein
MVQAKTIAKYKRILEDILNSGMSVSSYFKSIGKSPSSFYVTMSSIKEEAEKGIVELQELVDLYNRIKKDSNYKDIEDTIPSISEDSEQGIVLEYVRDDNDKIQKYIITVPVKDSIPFHTELSREKAESIFGLYTYYGGNITARNVTNEFPEYTLPDIKRIFRAFGLYKDSIWAPRHLVEELTIEQLSNYRMSLKERAAFKYADACHERDFKNTINKLASRILKLEDRNLFIEKLVNNGVAYNEYKVDSLKVNSSETIGIVFLSDIHVGAWNTPNGYLPLDDYNKEEINRRLEDIIKFISKQNWKELIVVNLGDSLDSYKGTTAKGTVLPKNTTDKQCVENYLSIMLKFFNTISSRFDKISYICTGDSNHDGSWGWLANVALVPHLNAINISSYVSSNPIDSFTVNNFSIVYLHGHDSSTQYKGFPLHLDAKTKDWFNNFFLQTNLNITNNRIVVKGDLHQYAVDSCNTFDYINAPSLYGSSSWIASNFGKGKSGVMYMEINEDKYTTGVIWN